MAKAKDNTVTIVDKSPIAELITAQIADSDFKFHTVTGGTPTVTLKMPDGIYKRGPVDIGQELVFTEAYVGKSGKMIFCFKPFDTQKWAVAEFNETEIDVMVPTFNGAIRETCGIDGEASTDRLVKLLVKRKKDRDAQSAAEREAEKVETVTNVYKNHPLFGRF